MPSFLILARSAYGRAAAFALIAACSAGLMAGIRSWALRDAPLTTDENSYVFQANLFAHGHLKHPFPGSRHAFQHEMIILDAEKGWFSRYPPGHPLWLTPGAYLKRPHAMVILGGMLAILLAWRTASALALPPIATALPLALSPFFLFTHATLLSHTTGLLATMLLIDAYVRWKDTTAPRSAMLAGLAWGWLLLTRPLTAACIAPVLALDALARLAGDPEPRARVASGLIHAAAAAAVGVACLLTYNAIMVGSPLVMTHTYYDPSDGIGFGGVHGHTFQQGAANVWTNLVLYDQWLWGWRGSLIAALGLALYGWDRRWSPWLLGCAATVIAAHVLFWHPGVCFTGPVYWFETLPFVVAAAALGIRRTFGEAARLRPVMAAVALILTSVAAGFVWREASSLRHSTASYARLRDAIRTAPRNALIMANSAKHKFTDPIHGLLIFNPRGLKSRAIMARVDSAADETFLRRLFPTKPVYFFNLAWGGLVPLPASQDPMVWSPALDDVASDTGKRLQEPGQPASRQGMRDSDPAGWLARGLLRGLTPGAYELEVELDSGFSPTGAGFVAALDTRLESGPALAKATLPAGCTGAFVRATFTVARVTEIDVRVWFAGTSDLTLRRITVRDGPSSPGTGNDRAGIP